MTTTELAELRADAIFLLAQSHMPNREAVHRLARAFLDAPPPLAWTDAKPTVAGWYWMRWPGTYRPRCVEIVIEHGDVKFASVSFPVGMAWSAQNKCQFAGPIQPPGLEAKERG